MWPSQHEVSESLRTSKMAVHKEDAGFSMFPLSWQEGAGFLEECVYMAVDQKGQGPLALCYKKMIE